MKFETLRIYFLSEFSVCCQPKILLSWQRDVRTSLYNKFGYWRSSEQILVHAGTSKCIMQILQRLDMKCFLQQQINHNQLLKGLKRNK